MKNLSNSNCSQIVLWKEEEEEKKGERKRQEGGEGGHQLHSIVCINANWVYTVDSRILRRTLQHFICFMMEELMPQEENEHLYNYSSWNLCQTSETPTNPTSAGNETGKC